MMAAFKPLAIHGRRPHRLGLDFCKAKKGVAATVGRFEGCKLRVGGVAQGQRELPARCQPRFLRADSSHSDLRQADNFTTPNVTKPKRLYYVQTKILNVEYVQVNVMCLTP